MTFDEAAVVLAESMPCTFKKGLFKGFTSVCIDSRDAVKGSLFVALPGIHTDGHLFAGAAFKKGAAGMLGVQGDINFLRLKEQADSYGAAIIGVENALDGLHALAAFHLDRFPSLLRVGITGSAGKTTVKEITHAIFSQSKTVIANKGNLNSETGLPLSLFNIQEKHQIGIFEAGMNHAGEIYGLAQILRPHIAMITNIGSAHIGHLGTRHAIAYEKKAFFSAFTGSETAVIPVNDQFAVFLAENVNGNVVFWGINEDKPQAGVSFKSLGLEGWEIKLENRAAKFPLPGSHNLKNAFAAAAIARAAGLSADEICAGFESVKPLFGRGRIIKVDEATVLCDYYNASPEAMAAAIKFCDNIEWNGPRVYVIGEMLELGEESEAAHAAIGLRIADSKAGAVFLFGKRSRPAFEPVMAGGKAVFFTEDIDELRREVKKQISANALVLLKGSRACALERVFESDQ
jgi:UDP-N-acetylmuramoyl-tripeptide--D-alanyl-D-alanine ligase